MSNKLFPTLRQVENFKLRKATLRPPATGGGGGGIATSVDNLNSTSPLTFWTGTQTEYNALGSWGANTLYFITGP